MNCSRTNDGVEQDAVKNSIDLGLWLCKKMRKLDLTPCILLIPKPLDIIA